MHVLLLGPDGANRSALEETLTRLGCVVMSADARGADRPPASGEVVVADLRADEDGFAAVAERLAADARPLVLVADRPRRLVKALAGRQAGTLVMTGAESDAGYRVALGVCRALTHTHRARAGATREWDALSLRAAN